jgi:SAM-dependent methyltransferase
VKRSDWTRIAHDGMAIMNPLSSQKLDEAIDAMGSVNGSMAIDLGCGKGELAHRLSKRHVGGVAVDISHELFEEGGGLEPGWDFVEADVTSFTTTQRYDIVVSIGSPAILSQLVSLVEPGGLVLYGNGYWRREPDPAYLAALGATREDLSDYGGTIAAGEQLGLTPLHAVVASVDDFDRYEWQWSRNGERFAAAHPDEPGVDEFLAWIRAGRRRYVARGGRETLGFGLFLFRT